LQPGRDDNPPQQGPFMNEHLSWLRRDTELHRGPLLKFLGAIGIALGLSSLCLVVSGLIGLTLGVAVQITAARDLSAMDAGLMDPRGRGEVETAQRWGTIALFSSLAGMVWGAVLLLFYFMGRF
jgi:hypothetical protein